ncbi:MAG TPA: putative toxin-antitoxin system toxin component, PIN family [Blastocatellia bacterium]|jgi:putative PIN family toxin of toxin-antitoxin system|nr:putative toxin-antitoxin system toxin component, PIN family [Blastocatellia bacterium]
MNPLVVRGPTQCNDPASSRSRQAPRLVRQLPTAIESRAAKDIHLVPSRVFQVVIDTNVLIAALRSRRGASHRLMMLIGDGRWQMNLSVPLVLEYEEVAKRLLPRLGLAEEDIDAILDYVCSKANLREIFYLWRPLLPDPKDDMVLELAVESQTDFIVTYNA